MKIALKFLVFCLFSVFAVLNPAYGQVPETVKTEASEPEEEGPIDDIVEKTEEKAGEADLGFRWLDQQFPNRRWQANRR